MDQDFPADLTAVEADELTAIEAALIAEFDEMHDSGEIDLARLEEIADQVEQVRAETARRDEEAQATAEAAAALAARIRPAAESNDDGDDETDPDDDSNGDAEGEAPDDGGTVDDADESADAQEREPVTAAASRRTTPSARAVSRRQPPAQVEPNTGGLVTITAAADVPGLAGGQRIDLTAVAQGMHDRARGLPARSNRASVATFHLPIPDEFVLPEGATPAIVASALDAAADPMRLTNAMVAAGGWCAPHDNMRELFEIEAADGLLDLPTIGITGGGINVPDFYGFGDADGALWTWTEANDIAALDPEGPRKPCLRIPCPDFTPYTLEAEGICLTHGNLSNRAWPALTARFVRLALNGHLHRLSAAKIAKIIADSIAFGPTTLPSDAPGDLLSAVEITVANIRSQHRLARTTMVEVVLPDWTPGALRASFAARAGVPLTNVSDADIAAHFQTRGARVQYVSDWQPLYDGGLTATWPDEVDFLAYVAGSYFEGNGGQIDLGVVRDSRLNETNDFTAAWSEQFYLVGRRGPQALRVTAQLGVDGVTACCPAPEEV